VTTVRPAPAPEAAPGVVRRVAGHVRAPLHRSGYSLVTTTFVTAALGALYWAIAARSYSTHDVGINASLISMMMLLTNLASLNFTDVLTRFVPVSREHTGRLVLTSYAVAVGLGFVSATIFVLGASWWAPWLSDVLDGPLLALVYVVATMLWVIFVVQDAVLVGLRRSTYVLIENTAFGVAKILLLLALAAIAPATGIFLSWTSPLLVIVVVVNVLIFGRLLARHRAEPVSTAETLDRREVTRFVGADYVASLAWTAAIAGMPIIVLWTAGASASAYVYLTWTIAYTLYLVSRNFGMALTTEGARDPDALGGHVRATLQAVARIVVPLAAVIVLTAPLILQFFGSDYARHATTLMRLLAVSAIPAIVPIVYVSEARVRRRLRAMVVVTLASTVPVLIATPLLVSALGINGVGVAWLAVQLVVAAALLLSGATGARFRRVEPAAIGPTTLRVAPAPDAEGDGDALPPPVSAPVAFRSVVTLPAAAPAPALPPLSDAPTPDGSTGAEPPVEEHATAATSPRRRRADLWPWATIGTALALWAVTLVRLPELPVGRYGLLSGLPLAYFLALAVVVSGIAVALRRGSGTVVVLAHVAVLIGLLHATPTIAYPALRYAWAWRHVGLVDLVQHHHAFFADTTVLPIYRYWPGFFGTAAAVTEGSGLRSAQGIATWAPPAFELLDALALVAVFRTLTTDSRRITIAVLLFVVANWVGQDYFSPQAFSFFLYLTLLAVLLRSYGRTGIPARRPDRTSRRSIAFTVVVLVAAIVTSHPLTPLVLCLAVVGLTVFRVLDRRWPAVLVVTVTVGWFLTGARPYALQNLKVLASGLGQLGGNVGSNLADYSQLSPEQHLVSTLGRGVVVVVALLAIAGALRGLAEGAPTRAALVLAVAPAGILAAGSYEGEAIFRVYLFALPFVAFLAAGLFVRRPGVRIGWRPAIAFVVTTALLLTGFLFAYYGKDAWSYFTPDEVRAAATVFDHAPPGSLLIAGTGSWPTEYRDVNRFTYVTLAAEPRSSLRRVLAHPVRTLGSWMADPRYSRAYLVLTRSQMAEADETGALPRGSLQRIRRALLASGRFEVVAETPDAVVFRSDPGAAP
jgi:O-antigen/teichoic acid export membrane protein